MIPVTITKYKCEICGTLFAEKGSALFCESKPASTENIVKVGDIVEVLYGEGKGELARVTATKVESSDRSCYHHTQSVSVEMFQSWGSRYLYCDHYIVVEYKNTT
jgi:hypothetical protein